jgi:hypothetical protein
VSARPRSFPLRPPSSVAPEVTPVRGSSWRQGHSPAPSAPESCWEVAWFSSRPRRRRCSSRSAQYRQPASRSPTRNSDVPRAGSRSVRSHTETVGPRPQPARVQCAGGSTASERHPALPARPATGILLGGHRRPRGNHPVWGAPSLQRDRQCRRGPSARASAAHHHGRSTAIANDHRTPRRSGTSG